MKKTPLFIIIPLFAVLVIVAVAMVLKTVAPTQKEVVQTSQKSSEFPNAVTNETVSKPSTFLGNLFGVKDPTPSPTPKTATDLSNELKRTYDDGGQSELDALSKAASAL